MAYYRRSAWTSTTNAAVAVKRKQVHATLHYPGFGSSSIRTAGWSRERCFQQLRAWRNMHVGSGAYREVAYNLYALPTGDVAEGRGNRQNGANGTSTANRAGMSVQVLIGDDEPLTEGHLKAIFAAFALLESWHPGITSRQYGHSHWVSTSCPGKHVRAGIPYRAGTKPSTGTAAAAPKPSVKADPNRQWATSPRVAAMSKAEVEDVQEVLTGFGYDLGKYGVDGSYGDATGAAVKDLQSELDLTADGVWGPATQEAYMTIKADIDYIKRVVVVNQGEIREARDHAKRGADVATVNQRAARRAASQTGPITRDGKSISLRQEVADSKTLALASAAREQAMLEAVQAASETGQPIDLDAVARAAETGVARALSSIEADVTVTLATDDEG